MRKKPKSNIDKIILSTVIVSALLISGFFSFFINEKTNDYNKTQLINDSVIPNKEKIKEDLENVNAFFIKNQGQLENHEIYFTYSSKNIDFAFLKSSISIKFTEKSKENIQRFSIIKLTFENSNIVTPKGLEEIDHKTNFFMGNDMSKWKNNILNYKKIVYENLYDGIDLIYYFDGNNLKYDWIINPYADPNQIIESYIGIEDIEIDTEGNLIIRSTAGELTENKPYSYQHILDQKIEVQNKYKKIEENKISYDIGDYDPSQNLIIDPMIYSTYVGGSHSDSYSDSSIVLDSQNNAYVTGDTYSHNFPITPGCYNDSKNGSRDVFVFKLSSDGSSLLYSTYIGGNNSDWSEGIVLDMENNVYITGATYSMNFPTTLNCYSDSLNGSREIFVCKLNSDGNSLIYSTFIGGKDHDYGKNIILDSENNAYVIGWTESSNFPTTSDCYDDLYEGDSDVIVFKLNSDGSDLVFSTFIGGIEQDYGYGITIDKEYNIYVTGMTSTSDFPTTPGCFNDLFNNGDFDIFVLKLDPNGSDLIYSTFIGGEDKDKSYEIALDSDNNAYITGYSDSSNFPTTPGCYNDSLQGSRDVIVFKLNPDGSKLIFSTFIGGSYSDYGYDIALDTERNSYITGYTKSSNFPTTIGCFDDSLNGYKDIFIFKLNSDASDLLYSTYYGGNSKDYGLTISIDSEKNAYLTGRTKSTDFPTSPGCYNDSLYGDYDVFVLKMNFTPTLTPVIKNVIPNSTLENENIYFEGIGIDGKIVRYAWRSDIDGEFYNGTEQSFYYSNLSNGTHIIYFKVKNDNRWSNEISTVLTINGIPNVHINEIIPNLAIEYESVRFSGSGTDDGTIVDYQWSSSIDGVFSHEKDFSTKTLSKGNHEISLKVKDDFGIWSKTISTSIMIHSIPIADIIEIYPYISLEGEEVLLNGTGIDDGTIKEYFWSSSIDGFLSKEQLFSRTNLSNGSHTIQLKVKDNFDIWSEEVSTTMKINGFPRAIISGITPKSVNESEIVEFYGHGIDDRKIVDYEWSSSIFGFLSSEKSFSISNLSNGIHTIYFRVKDNYGIWSNKVQTNLIINDIPISRINDVTLKGANEGEEVWFSGNAVDEGTIKEYKWMSDKDGLISSEKSFKIANLSNGTHRIYFSVKDDNDVWSEEVFTTISINGIPRAEINEIKPKSAYDMDIIWFYGNGTDDGLVDKYQWNSDIDGYLSSKRFFSTSGLSTETHTINFIVRDNYGLWSKETSMTLKISVKYNPVISIGIEEDSTIDKNDKIYEIKGTALLENEKIEKIQIKIDDGNWQDAVGTENWSYTWDISNLEKEEHTISVRAFYGNSYSEIKETKINIIDLDSRGDNGFEIILVLPFILIFMIIIGFLSIKKQRTKGFKESIEEEETYDKVKDIEFSYDNIEQLDSEKESSKTTSLTDKDILLRELHHRVKNNLQVVSSLLYLQSEEFVDQAIHDKFKETEERIKSMALIHETLYRSNDLENVDFKSYIKSLTSNLFASYGIDRSRIKLEIDVEASALKLDHSIPLGLIINELVSNSLKYAFPDNGKGKIRISLHSKEDDLIELIVRDNGIGISNDLDLRTTESLGLHLVTMLVEDQLNGEIEMDKIGGTTFLIKFGVLDD